MNSLSRKRVFGNVCHCYMQRKDEKMCIICQGRSNKGLFNEKSYKLAEKKHLQSSSAALAGQKCSTLPSTSPRISTKNHTQQFDANCACIVCNKRWMKGKEPTCKSSTESSQQAIIVIANTLNREDILLRLIGQGHDMVANGISYPAPYMNATPIPISRYGQQNMYDIAFGHLVVYWSITLKWTLQ